MEPAKGWKSGNGNFIFEKKQKKKTTIIVCETNETENLCSNIFTFFFGSPLTAKTAHTLCKNREHYGISTTIAFVCYIIYV